MKSSSVALIAICLCLGVSSVLGTGYNSYDTYGSIGGGYSMGYGKGYSGYGHGYGHSKGYGKGYGKGYVSTETIIRQPYMQAVAAPPPLDEDNGVFGLGIFELLILGLPLLLLLRDSNSG